jgi:RNA polymerase sigma factor (sigma-70 family)
MTDKMESGNLLLEDAARAAIGGDRSALDQLVRELQGDIYGLSLRMLCNREDAEDATQEILVRIVTRLAQFNFRSKLKTWAYRVAVNYILDVKKSAVERMQMSFESMADNLTEGLDLAAPSETEESLLIEEVKIGCSMGMLQCLDRSHRIAYILGELLELSGPEAAEALDITPVLFRKRLQEAREAIVSFTKRYCGLVSDAAPCRCNRLLPKLVRIGSVNPKVCGYAAKKASFLQTRAMVRGVEEARWALQVHRTSSPRASTVDFARQLSAILDAS